VDTEVPQKPETSSWVDLFLYYHENKQQIMSDYKSKGFNKTLNKWDMTHRRLSVLLKRWGILPVEKTPLTIPRIE